MPKNIEDHLLTIETRLGETLEAFVVARQINEACNKETSPALNAAINRRGGFWQAVLVSLQTTQFVGINALLDRNSNDSATLYLVANELERTNPAGVLPPTLIADLDVIRDRYKKYRHKLFGHNDKDRDNVINNFNNAGFTWQSLSQDLFELEYAFKVLFEAMRGRPIPSKERAKEIQFPYNVSVERAAKDTAAILAENV